MLWVKCVSKVEECIVKMQFQSAVTEYRRHSTCQKMHSNINWGWWVLTLKVCKLQQKPNCNKNSIFKDKNQNVIFLN